MVFEPRNVHPRPRGPSPGAPQGENNSGGSASRSVKPLAFLFALFTFRVWRHDQVRQRSEVHSTKRCHDGKPSHNNVRPTGSLLLISSAPHSSRWLRSIRSFNSNVLATTTHRERRAANLLRPDCAPKPRALASGLTMTRNTRRCGWAIT